jgi:hypothetical protein
MLFIMLSRYTSLFTDYEFHSAAVVKTAGIYLDLFTLMINKYDN